MRCSPKVLVFDSGLGGLTVFARLRATRPDAAFVYVADDAGFPYGQREEAELRHRIVDVVGSMIEQYAPDAVVIACNTASTMVLPPLRLRWPTLPFVGTVPAVKPAAAASRSKVIAVLATPGTVARDYTRALVDAHAADCHVVLVGSCRLAPAAEAAMTGEQPPDGLIAAEIAPCFVSKGERRTDAVVLACTHYPLLLDAFMRQAPWPVTWIDPAPAIAQQLNRVLAPRFVPEEGGGVPRGAAIFRFISGAVPNPVLVSALLTRGLAADGIQTVGMQGDGMTADGLELKARPAAPSSLETKVG